MYDEVADAADDWELEALRQEEEERQKLEEQERLKKEKEEKDKKRRLASSESQVHTETTVELTEDAKQVLQRAQQEQQDAFAAADLLEARVERLADRKVKTVEEHRALGQDIAKRVAEFDGDHLASVSATIFEHLLRRIPTSKALRDMETLLNVAKAAAKANRGDKAKSSKTSVAVSNNQNALNLDTTDRGGAAEAQDDCGW